MTKVYLMTDGDYVYVGKTKNPLFVRLAGHVKAPSSGRPGWKSAKNRWIRWSKKTGREIEILLLDTYPDEVVGRAEANWVRLYAKAYGRKCLNVRGNKFRRTKRFDR